MGGLVEGAPADTLAWLLDGDPSIRRQVLRNLTGALRAEVEVERALIATSGVYVVPYNLGYLALLVADTTLGILTRRRRTGRRLGQAGLAVVALQMIAVVAFTMWAVIDRAPV